MSRERGDHLQAREGFLPAPIVPIHLPEGNEGEQLLQDLHAVLNRERLQCERVERDGAVFWVTRSTHEDGVNVQSKYISQDSLYAAVHGYFKNRLSVRGLPPLRAVASREGTVTMQRILAMVEKMGETLHRAGFLDRIFGGQARIESDNERVLVRAKVACQCEEMERQARQAAVELESFLRSHWHTVVQNYHRLIDARLAASMPIEVDSFAILPDEVQTDRALNQVIFCDGIPVIIAHRYNGTDLRAQTERGASFLVELKEGDNGRVFRSIPCLRGLRLSFREGGFTIERTDEDAAKLQILRGDKQKE